MKTPTHCEQASSDLAVRPAATPLGDSLGEEPLTANYMKQREIWEDPEIMESPFTRRYDLNDPAEVTQYYEDLRVERAHRKHLIDDRHSILEVRKYGLRLEFTEFGVFRFGERIADGFDSREAAVTWINEKASSGEPKA